MEAKFALTPSYDLNPAKKRGINSGSGLRSLRSVNHAVINKINPSISLRVDAERSQGIKFATDEAEFKRAVGLYENANMRWLPIANFDKT